MNQMSNLREESSSSCREFLKKFEPKIYPEFSTWMMEQNCNCVSRCVKEVQFDFSGTDSARSDNLNATEAIVSKRSMLLFSNLDW